MVFNRDILFIHLGKTGGISVANYLCRVLRPPVVSVVRYDEFDKLHQVGHEIMVPWKRHANLVEAEEFLKTKHMAIQDFSSIIIVIRNPVDLDFSYYRHLRTPRYIKKLSQKPFHSARLEAAQKDYAHFAGESYTHYRGNLRDYFEIDGIMPKNLKIVRFEKLAEEIPAIVNPYSINTISFPHRNKSSENFERPPLMPQAIESIRRKYQWIYEKGFYRLPKK